MTKREEYADKLKAQIDEWNADIDRFEQKAEQAGEELRRKYQEELAALRQRRDEVSAELARVYKASDDAWDEVWHGAEEAWKVMKDAFARARSRFNE